MKNCFIIILIGLFIFESDLFPPSSLIISTLRFLFFLFYSVYKKNYENKEIDKTSSTGIILNHIIIFIIEGIFSAFILYLLQKQIIERQLYKLYSKILKKDDSMLDSSYNEPLYLKVLEKLI